MAERDIGMEILGGPAKSLLRIAEQQPEAFLDLA